MERCVSFSLQEKVLGDFVTIIEGYNVLYGCHYLLKEGLWISEVIWIEQSFSLSLLCFGLNLQKTTFCAIIKPVCDKDLTYEKNIDNY